MNEETEFAYRIRQALNEGLERIDYKTQVRLEQARKTAIARHRAPTLGFGWRPVPQTAGADAAFASPPRSSFWDWLRPAGMVAPVIALLVGFFAVQEWHEQRRIADLAALDFAVLMDELPVETYADKSFEVLLKKEQGL